MAVTQVLKRDLSTVSFNKEKIWKAISKAFLDVKKNFTPEEAHEVDMVTMLVVEELEKVYQHDIPSVENIQDTVERKLMERGFYEVAKGYILYRKEHEAARAEEEARLSSAHPTLRVEKSSGELQALNTFNIRKTLEYAAEGLSSDLDIEGMVQATLNSVYDRIPTKELSKVMVMVARSYIERDPDYSYLAANLLLNVQYRRVIGAELNYETLEEQYRTAFVKNIHDAVEMGFLDPQMKEYNLEWLASHMKPERDKVFKFLGIQTLYDRYFVTDPVSKRMFETPQAFWMRVAMGVALGEKPEDRERYALEFYEIMSPLHYIPSTPTLFHAGTNNPQLSSCYLNTVEDDLTHIFKVMGDNAQMSKWSGGIGTDWTNLRSTGALIKGTGVESQGIVPFLKVANDTTAAINRSGKRRGAAVVYLETWHLDLDDFLELRKNTGDERRRTHDMNTANWIPDLFMQRVQADGDWTLFSPDETPELHHIFGQAFKAKYEEYEQKALRGEMKQYRVVKAKDLWKKMVSMLFETGHPWMTFKDACNVRSPQDHVGVIHNSNLCTEITLNNSAEETAVCNLGSLHLKYYCKDGQFDRDLVARVVPTAMRMLDNVIDINFYPTAEGKVSNMRHRPVGLGVSGLHDLMYQLDIRFDSEKGVDFSDEMMEVIAYHAIYASSKLAKERGAYQTYPGSKWDRGMLPIDTLDLLEKERGTPIPVDRISRLDWSPVRMHIKQYGMRNSNTMAIAPTATTANIGGTIPAIEPIYKNLYVKANQGGDFVVVNDYLIEDLKKLGLWNREMVEKLKYFDGNIAQIPEIPESTKLKYQEVFDIDGRWLIKAAAYRSKWIDQSQSLNIFYKGVSGKDISDIYTYAWEMGIKTTYYLRTLGISQVEKSTVDLSQFGKTHTRDFKKSPAQQLQQKSAPQSVEPEIQTNPAPESSAPMVTQVNGEIVMTSGYTPKSNIISIVEGQICESCSG